jgi:hypothetical protein
VYPIPVRFSSKSGSKERNHFGLRPRIAGKREWKQSSPRGRARRYLLYAGLVVGFCALLAFAGCGISAGNGQLVATLSGVNFGPVTVGHVSQETVSFTNTGIGAVQVSSVNVSGGGFKLADPTTFPITVAAKATYSLQVSFSPSAAGQASGAVTVMSNATSAPPVVNLAGIGVNAAVYTGALSGISCTASSVTGTGADNCYVALNGAAGNGGVTVNLTSTSDAVQVPLSVTVPANTNGVGFTANVTAVATAQSAVLTATAGGVSESFALDLNAAIRVLSVSATQVSFGSVSINSTATESVILTSAGTEPVTIESTTLKGSGYSIGALALPVILNPGQQIVLNVQFTPTAVSAGSTGKVMLTTNDSSGSAVVIDLSGAGTAAGGSGGSTVTPVPAGLSCSATAITGAGVDTCNVTLSAAASIGGVTVNLSSNTAALAVPASVTIPNGAISAGFTATAAAVGTAQTATLTATANGSAKTFAIELNAAGAVLSASAASLAFGDISLNGLGAQTLTLASTGTQAVTVSSAILAGSAFTMSGAAFPVTMNPGQSLTLQVQFIPTVAGAASGQIAVTSNATTGGTMVIPLSGTGAIPYNVNLTWSAPATSTDAVAGYHVYRALNGTSTYQLLNSAVNSTTSYSDTTPEDGQSYVYYVTSVDSAGVESLPSNAFSVTIP